MKILDVTKYQTSQLLVIYGDILDELKKRDIVRSRNNPVADYAEWIVSKALNLKLESNSKEGYDATDSNGLRYQIKGRRLQPSNASRQLGVIRNLDDNKFDYLIGVLFQSDFTILEAYKIPHELIKDYGRYSKHQNGHILILKGNILKANGVESLDSKLCKCV